MARPLTKEGRIENHICEIQALALSALGYQDIPKECRGLLLSLLEKAHYTQGVFRGVRTKNHKFNDYLADLMGIDSLN